MRTVLVAAAVVGVALAGCLNELPDDDVPEGCETAPPVLRQFPPPDSGGLVGGSGHPIDLLYVFETPGPIRLDRVVAPGWRAVVHAIGPATDDASVIHVRLEPEGQARGGTVHATWTADAADPACPPQTGTTASTPIETHDGAEVSAPGQGVHVYTAGFWENGTLFYTNMRSVHASDWPRAGWYEWEGDGHLPVYVYDASGDEKPPHWTAPALPGQEPAWNYHVTIPGFNEGLKGLATDTVRLAWMPPEEAYTREGNEDHVLYGDALLFMTVSVDVVDAPCPETNDDGTCAVQPPV